MNRAATAALQVVLCNSPASDAHSPTSFVGRLDADAEFSAIACAELEQALAALASLPRRAAVADAHVFRIHACIAERLASHTDPLDVFAVVNLDDTAVRALRRRLGQVFDAYFARTTPDLSGFAPIEVLPPSRRVPR